ncbi:MAG: TonB-dependent receptor, partial [Gammaproteobacteria bacterium]
GPFDLTLYYRNTAGGFRDALNEDTLVDFLAGFNGTMDLMGGMDWEIAAQHSTGISDQTSTGLGFASTLDDRIDAADGLTLAEAMAQLAADPTSIYDVFGLAGDSNFESIVPSASHTGLSDYEHRVASADGQVSFDLLQMPAGPLAAAFGFEYRDEKFLQDFDAQQNAANVAGSAGAADVSGARVAKSLFAELAIPVVDIVEVSVAGRYDDYNDFGTTFNPKVAVGVRPIDSVLLRASYGEGFRAPSMSELYSAPVQSFNNAVDTRNCNAAPRPLPNPLPANHPCATVQFQNFSGGNTMLDPELSESMNVGVVWNPLDDLSLSFDYFDVELEDQIGTLPLQAILDAEAAMGSSPFVIRNNRGEIFVILANSQNIAGTTTKGYDIDMQYGFSLGALGDFQSQLQVSKVIEYLEDQGDGNGFQRLQGTFDPDLRAALSLGWSRGDFSAGIIGNHITDTENDEPLNDDGTMNTGFAHLASWTTWDVSVGWATPWNGEITIGARNVFDRDPPTNPAIGNPNYTETLHDVFGRVPFIRYEQNL